MALLVQKFGGATVATFERMKAVAEKIKATKEKGNSVVVVASAMGDTTDDFLDNVAKLCPEDPPAREVDMLLMTGEQQSIDWRGMGVPVNVVSRATYDETGAVTSWRSPYVPGVDSPQGYEYRYRRGYLDGLLWGTVPFLEPDRVPRSLEYSPAGSLLAIRF